MEPENNPIMGSNGLESSSFQLIVEKLSEKNYWEWVQSIKLVSDGAGKLSYLTDETKRPSDVNLLPKWKSKNSMVTA